MITTDMDISCRYKSRAQLGFSLIELATTLAVSITVIAAGLPAMQRFMANQQMAASMNAVASHLHLARSEAIKRGLRAVLCPSLDGESCLKSSEWQQGFILFADDNINKKRDAGEKLLRRFQPGEKKQHIRITSTDGRQQIRYQATGEAPGSNLTITFCDIGGTVDPKAIIISQTGRSRISTVKPNGGPLDC